MNIKSIIESILFVAGRPVSLKELAKVTKKSEDEILVAISELQKDRAGAGIVILEQNNSFLMTTDSANTGIVKDFLNAELREKLTDAAIETLAIVAYKQPASRAEIEAIRGVNSQYTLRLLLMRGLIERLPNPKDSRTHLYQTTHEFLQHLGIKNIKDLPDFAEIQAKIQPPADESPTIYPSPSEGRVPPKGGGEVANL